MSIHPSHLRHCVIRPALEKLELYSKSAENLLMGTCAQESALGYYLKQIKGPALGIYQVEPKTHDDILKNFLAYRKTLSKQVFSLGNPDEFSLTNNLAYATAIARVHYLRVAEPLPDANNIEALARYYKQYFNTPLGKATEQDFIINYKRYVTDE